MNQRSATTDPTPPGLQEALAAHEAGRLDAACQAYSRVLEAQPEHIVALANLASIHTRLGRFAEAMACYQTALRGRDVTAELWFNYGNLQQRQGLLKDAAKSFETALRMKPGLYPAHYNLANALRDDGQEEKAIGHYRAAITLNPRFAPAHRNLGNLLRRLERAEDAVEHHRIAVSLEPERADNHYNLGNALADVKEVDAAMESYRAALRLSPAMVAAWLNLGNLEHAAGNLGAAEEAYQRASAQPDAPAAAFANLVRMRIKAKQREAAQELLARALARFPDDPEILRLHADSLFHREDAEGALAIYQRLDAMQPGQANLCNALGVAYRAVGQLTRAEEAWMRCLAIEPEHVEAMTNLGTFCRLQKRHEEALKHLRRAIEIRPDDPDSVASLSCTLIDLGFISEAMGLIEPVLAKNPEHADLMGMKAFALVHQARIDEGQAVLAAARKLLPDSQVAISNTLFSSLYSDTLDCRALTGLHRELAATISRKAKPGPVRPLRADRRPLRIGYLSPDLRSHPIGFFIEPVLAHHDRERFHSTCYALPCAADETTTRLMGLAHRWRDFEGWNVERMAAQIRADQIDVLVDLAGYTAGGRMDLMAHRPAPVQAVFLGYPSTTGLAEMDYIIADGHIIPPQLEFLYSERIARLAHSFLCYQPQPGCPEVAPLPARRQGFVTFGSYNNLPKVSTTSIELWARVLKAVPNSRLALMASSLADEGTREMFREHFVRRGIAGERILPLPPVTPLASFMAEYGRVDIALDPVPYNGGTTSCDALWMGLPVVTLTGERFVSRMGTSLLTTLGHPEWIATDADEYVRIAATLAGDIDRLAAIRAGLRDEVRASGLADAVGYTGSLERLYLDMVEANSR